jgi:hypothetical protein
MTSLAKKSTWSLFKSSSKPPPIPLSSLKPKRLVDEVQAEAKAEAAKRANLVALYLRQRGPLSEFPTGYQKRKKKVTTFFKKVHQGLPGFGFKNPSKTPVVGGSHKITRRNKNRTRKHNNKKRTQKK